MSAARIANVYFFNGCEFAEYVCDKAGDELPLHSHDFDHITIAKSGRCEAFYEADPAEELTLYLLFRAGYRHGIRALEDGARFVNVRAR